MHRDVASKPQGLKIREHGVDFNWPHTALHLRIDGRAELFRGDQPPELLGIPGDVVRQIEEMVRQLAESNQQLKDRVVALEAEIARLKASNPL